jgi:hypothetical protein
MPFPLSKHWSFLKHSGLFWKNSLGLPSCCECLVRTCRFITLFILRESLLTLVKHFPAQNTLWALLVISQSLYERERNSSLYLRFMTIELSQNVWLAWVHLMIAVSDGEWEWQVSGWQRIIYCWMTALHRVSRSDLQENPRKKDPVNREA